jgi:hypothetical protein
VKKKFIKRIPMWKLRIFIVKNSSLCQRQGDWALWGQRAGWPLGGSTRSLARDPCNCHTSRWNLLQSAWESERGCKTELLLVVLDHVAHPRPCTHHEE